MPYIIMIPQLRDETSSEGPPAPLWSPLWPTAELETEHGAYIARGELSTNDISLVELPLLRKSESLIFFARFLNSLIQP